MKFIYTLLIFVLLANMATAQHAEHFCGMPDGHSPWLKKFQQRPAHLKTADEEELWIPVQIHLVGTDGGSGFYNLSSVYRDFCELQKQFLHTNIRLYLTEEISYIYSSQLYYHTEFNEGLEVTAQYNNPNAINSYVTESAAGACGYAAFLGSNTVVLAINCIGAGSSTWAHEIGHSLSLPHNFSNNSLETSDNFQVPAPDNFERVDGSNCSTAGDGFCDTPPDYLGFRWNCNNDDLSARVQLDPDSVAFRSEGKYFMSYANDGCMGIFSDEQTAAMRAFIREEKPEYLQGNPNYLPIEAEDIGVSIPEDGGTIEYDNGYALIWEELENVEEYIVEVSRFPSFSAIEFRGNVKRNFFPLKGNVINGLTYYWRVRPSNRAHLCHNYYPTRTFTVQNTTTSASYLSHTSAMQIYPNPVQQNQSIVLDFDATARQDLQLQIIDILGKKHFNQGITSYLGGNQFEISTENLSPGLFYIIVQNDTETWQNKIIIQ